MTHSFDSFSSKLGGGGGGNIQWHVFFKISASIFGGKIEKLLTKRDEPKVFNTKIRSNR